MRTAVFGIYILMSCKDRWKWGETGDSEHSGEVERQFSSFWLQEESECSGWGQDLFLRWVPPPLLEGNAWRQELPDSDSVHPKTCPKHMGWIIPWRWLPLPRAGLDVMPSFLMAEWGKLDPTLYFYCGWSLRSAGEWTIWPLSLCLLWSKTLCTHAHCTCLCACYINSKGFNLSCRGKHRIQMPESMLSVHIH